MTELDKYVNLVLISYDHYKAEAYSHILDCWPRFDNYNNFEKFIILNLVVIGLYLIITCLASFSIKKTYKTIIKLVFNLPPVKSYLEKQLKKNQQGILAKYPDHLRPKLDKIPFKAVPITIGDSAQKQVLKGKYSGSRYAMESHSKFVINLAKLFAYSNPLHIDMFPLVKQMEVQVVAMTADFIGLKDENGKICGTVNSGGTESIIMALLAYRQYYMKERGIVKPNLVLCDTAHCAALKGAAYLDLEIRIIPFDSNYQMNISKMKSAIDSQTICVYTSYPNYPFGTADDIDIIGPYCKRRGVAVHCDMCLGGYVIPFIDKNWKVPQGITSISADSHKYGLAAKGVSVLLFSHQKFWKSQFFVTCYWPGGLYGTPGLAGSRSGVFIASAWVSMMKLGRKGFEQNAKLVYDTLVKLNNEFEKLGFEIISKAKLCVFSFKHPKIPVNAIQNFMKDRGWGFSINQNPFSFQFSLTPMNCLKSDEMIKDIKDCLNFYEKNGYPKKQSSEIAAYGTCHMIKDDGKKDFVLASVLDTYIDLEI